MTKLETWLDELSEKGRKNRKNCLEIFEKWLKSKHAFRNLDEAVAFQKAATGDDRYKIVDLLVRHVKERGGTYSTMRWRYATIRSFFLHVRSELPKNTVAWQPTKDATTTRLNVDVLPTLLSGASIRDRAIYLTLFQGLMDQHRFFNFFNLKGYELGQHIKTQGVRIPLPR